MDEINVLSWNVWFKGMNNLTRRNNVIRVINDSIEKNNVSLIGTQETAELNETNFLPNNIKWISDDNKTKAMISFNNNYTNITNIYFKGNTYIHGDFNADNNKDISGNKFARNRPYQFVILLHKITKNIILYINLWNDHDEDVQKNLNHINNKLNGLEFNYIIITGDFNTLVDDNKYVINNKNLNRYTLDEPTCCNEKNEDKMEFYPDNILTYGFDEIETIKLIKASENILYSDHLPVLVKLKFSNKIILNNLEILIKLLADKSFQINKLILDVDVNKIEYNILKDILRNKLK